jgi:hypothetical protein
MRQYARETMKPEITRAIFSMEGYCVWDPSLVTDAQGRHHLFFSRWPIDAMKEGEAWSRGFESWVTHSEVCRATAETPFGPYHFAEVVLPKRPGYWDGDVTHNPSIRRFGDRYYLYYNGNQSDGGWWDHRNNQRVGVAIADRPEGPWTRFDKPLLDVTPGAWDAMCTNNAVCAQAPDGRYILLYKGVGDRLPLPKYGPVLHGVAFADRPEGPFVKHPEPIFASEDAAFPGEDPFVWCQDGRYHALLKDQGTYYSPSHKAIVRFESEDGLHWAVAEDPMFQEKALIHEDGRREEVHRLERPFLYCTEDGPEIFFCAVKSRADRHDSIIATMSLKPQGTNPRPGDFLLKVET